MGIGDDLIGDVERLLVARVLDRRSLFRMTGPSSDSWRAEQEIEAMYPGMRCLLLPSATVGLSLLLESLAAEPGGEVLIAPFGWLSNWSCITRAGLAPRFLPLDDTLQVTENAVRDRLGPRTVAVIVTHLMGRGQQHVDAIAAACAEKGIPLFEDIAQSFGVSVRGRRAGTFGSAAWCSLNHHKILSTGDGGFLLVRDQTTFARIGALHDQGCVMRDGKRRPGDPLRPGLSLRSTDLVAAVLRAQLARFHLIRARILAKHEALASALREELNVHLVNAHQGDVPFTVLFERPPGSRYPSLAQSGWHVAGEVAWLEQTFGAARAADPDLDATLERLSRISAVGAGFIDPYYAIAAGVTMDDAVERIPGVVRELEQALAPSEATR